MKKIIINKDIVLKEIDLTDSTDIFQTIDQQREYLREWLPFVDHTNSINDTIAFINSVSSIEETKTDLVFVILFQNSFAGLISFKAIDYQNKKTEIGYWLSEPFQGKGIMTSSCKGILKYAFEELGMNRVQIRVAINNTKSKKIPEKLSFKLEGIERDGEQLALGFTDLCVYSLLQKEME